MSVSLGSLDKGPLAQHVVNCWSDVYSFGMTILHTFIGDELFERFRSIFFKPMYRASAGLFSECFKDLRGASNELLDLLTRLLVGWIIEFHNKHKQWTNVLATFFLIRNFSAMNKSIILFARSTGPSHSKNSFWISAVIKSTSIFTWNQSTQPNSVPHITHLQVNYFLKF